MTHRFYAYETRQALAEQLANQVANQLHAALANKDHVSLGVPGGTTPGPFLEALSQCDLDWARVTVTLTDERWVSPDSDRSNYGLLTRSLQQNAAKEAKFLALYRAAVTPEPVLAELNTSLAPLLPFDVCVLGMGTDMHTASLFPNADRLTEGLDSSKPASLLPIRLPGEEEIRLTFTAPAFEKAGAVHVLITGPAKKAALEQAIAAPDARTAPIRIALDHPNASVHYSE